MLSIVRVNCAGFDSFQTEVRLGRDGSTGEVVARISRSPVLQVTWVDETSVHIFAPQGYSLDVQKKESDGVHIEFR
jgi:hypothetical protein